MTLTDVSLLGKKILVGIVVTLVPFIIIAGGLWLTQRILSGENPKPPIETKTKTNKP